MTQAQKNASFAYSVNLLRLLRAMRLLTEEEYARVLQISAKHYGVAFSGSLCLK